MYFLRELQICKNSNFDNFESALFYEFMENVFKMQ